MAKRLRIIVLSLALAGTALWGYATVRRRQLRTDWHGTLQIAVVVLGQGAVPEATSTALRLGLPRLNDLFARQFAKYQGGAGLSPIEFVYQGVVPVDTPPPMPGSATGLIERARYGWTLHQYLKIVDQKARLDPGAFDARLYVFSAPANDAASRFMEGAGAMNGDVGLVRTELDASAVDLTLLAVGHELMHCLGASDKYDADGHAVAPGGLAEPDRSPAYPQRYAEIMVGEIPTSDGEGRLPGSLDQVAVGPATAREIGWLSKAP